MHILFNSGKVFDRENLQPKIFFMKTKTIIWALMVLIPTMALAAPARGVSFQEQPDPFIPEHAVDLIRQASQFYFRNFTVQNPSVYPEENLGHHLSEEDKAKIKYSLDWAMPT